VAPPAIFQYGFPRAIFKFLNFEFTAHSAILQCGCPRAFFKLNVRFELLLEPPFSNMATDAPFLSLT
jgi:hypothetical protein